MPRSRPRSQVKYYAVYEGRVDEPTIYSSWAQAHPRVTQCHADHASFDELGEAIIWMEGRGVTKPKIVPRNEDKYTGKKDTQSPKGKYYAVAYGKTTGVFTKWEEEAKAAVSSFDSACHQRFDFEREAKAFIEEWKDAYAEVLRREIRQGLDEGWKPEDLKVDLGRFLVREDGGVDDEEILCKGVEGLDIKREDTGIKSSSLV